MSGATVASIELSSGGTNWANQLMVEGTQRGTTILVVVFMILLLPWIGFLLYHRNGIRKKLSNEFDRDDTIIGMGLGCLVYVVIAFFVAALITAIIMSIYWPDLAVWSGWKL